MNKYQLKNRLVIGTANFTQKYGAYPTKVNLSEVRKIISYANKNNIFKIDTADAYLRDKKIFKNISSKLKFSSKIEPDRNWISLEYCQKKLDKHLSFLNTRKINTLLIHNSGVLLSKNGDKIFKNLENLKNKYFNKIGISIYETNNLEYALSNFDIDVIQCPYNILDKRIITSGWYDKLKRKEIEIHIRSIFLQGLLVNKNVYKKKYFKNWNKRISDWFERLNSNKISPIDYCLNDILYYDFDNIIIGINNLSSLKEILNFKKINMKKILQLTISDLKLIDPRKWK